MVQIMELPHSEFDSETAYILILGPLSGGAYFDVLFDDRTDSGYCIFCDEPSH